MTTKNETVTAAGNLPAADNNYITALHTEVARVLVCILDEKFGCETDIEPGIVAVYRDHIDPVLHAARDWKTCPAALLTGLAVCRAAIGSTLDPFIGQAVDFELRPHEGPAHDLFNYVWMKRWRHDQMEEVYKFWGTCAAVEAHRYGASFNAKRVTDEAFGRMVTMQSDRVSRVNAIIAEGHRRDAEEDRAYLEAKDNGKAVSIVPGIIAEE